MTPERYVWNAWIVLCAMTLAGALACAGLAVYQLCRL